jgi:nitroimidazol reductase NimA-like FMN-containing flavoprotein (pyridoxamine 5'-phosphate oxidase superfamily)
VGDDRVIGGTTDRSRVRRIPELARYDAATVHEILDETPYCHVGFVLEDGVPCVLPIIHDRVGDHLYFHGSRSNRMLRAMTGPAGACVTATTYSGLVLARSVFNHTVCYRTAVVFGHPEVLTDPQERSRALSHLVDHVLPGRSAEAREPSTRELALTTVVRMRIEEASAKVETGPPEDDAADVELPVWAGVVPLTTRWGAPVPAPDGPRGLSVPPSVRGLYRAPPSTVAVDPGPSSDP